MSDVTILRADRWVDVEAGEVRSPAVIVVEGNRIVERRTRGACPTHGHRDRPRRRDAAARADGHGAQHAHRRARGPDGLPDPMHGVQGLPVYRTLRGVVNCRTTLHGRVHDRAEPRA